MSTITVEKGILNPGANINSFIPEQFTFRNTGEFVGTNRIAILHMEESVWWNRPLHSNEMLKLEDDGLYSYNLPFLGDRDTYKTGYNLLLPLNGIAIISHIKFDQNDSEEFRQKIYDLSYKVLYDSLIELGMTQDHLSQKNNDTLYDGKKFAGGEKKIIGDVFTEDMIITMDYSILEDVFKRITGKYAKVRNITGASDEMPSISSTLLINKLYDKFISELGELNAYTA